jgi:hypothetical protein
MVRSGKADNGKKSTVSSLHTLHGYIIYNTMPYGFK